MTRQLALAALLLTASAAPAQTLTGQLLAPDGTPHAHALLLLESGRIGPGIVDSTRSDADGRFAFELGASSAFALGTSVGGAQLWLPLIVPEGADALDVEIRRPAGQAPEPERSLDGVAVTSTPAIVGELMDVYVRAERFHRTPLTSPALDRFSAIADSTMGATPLARKIEVQDSLRQLGGALYEAVIQPRVDAFLAPFEAETRPLVRAACALWALDKVSPDSAPPAC